MNKEKAILCIEQVKSKRANELLLIQMCIDFVFAYKKKTTFVIFLAVDLLLDRMVCMMLIRICYNPS